MGKKEYKVGAVSNLLASDGSTGESKLDKKLVDVFSNNPFKARTDIKSELQTVYDNKPKKSLKTAAKAAKAVTGTVAAHPAKIMKKEKDKKAIKIGFEGTSSVGNGPSGNPIEEAEMLPKKKKKNKRVKIEDMSMEIQAEAPVTNPTEKKNKRVKIEDMSMEIQAEAPVTNATEKIKKKVKIEDVSMQVYAEPPVAKATRTKKENKRVKIEDVSMEVQAEPPITSPTKTKKKKKSKLATNDEIISAFDKEQGLLDPSDDESDVDETTKIKDSKAEKKALKNFQLNTPKEKKIEEEARTVFVGNLPPTILKKYVLKMFKKCGKVEAVRLRCGTPLKPYLLKKVAINCKKLNPNQSSLAAYVRFSTIEEARKAIQDMNGVEVDKHHIVVDTSLPVKKDRKKSVFLGNVAAKTGDDELRKLFADCGEIESIRLVRDSCTGLAKGFGFVNFKESSSVQLALKKHGTVFNGRELRVMSVVKKLKKPKGEKDKLAEQTGPKTHKFAKNNAQYPYQRKLMTGAERRIENRKKFAFGGDQHAEGKVKTGYKKPNKTALKKANIASQLTGVSKTQIKKSLGQKRNNQ